MDDELVGLALVVVLAVGAQLLAARLAVPAIVPLLAAGVLAGDVTGLVDPAALLGPALTDAVALAVGVILFEGALGLRREELIGAVGSVVARLVSIGALLTWAGATVAVAALLDVPHPIAVLVGAVLIVSGPTVVLPMLEFIRPTPRVRAILKWEGIVIDPVGAIAAVAAFNALEFGAGELELRAGGFALTLLAGLVCGVAGAAALLPLLRARWLPERQKAAATLMAVVGAFAAADVLREDAGLVAAIAMGVVLANQRRVDIARIVEFKETLGAILLGLLFVLLAATVDLADVAALGSPALVLVAVLVLVVRPLVVAVCAWRADLSARERVLLAALAPRGVVAASTASVFGLSLAEDGAPGANLIVPVVFTVIAGTVIVSALVAPPLARRLGVVAGAPAGVLVVGGAPWARELARALRATGVDARIWSPRASEAAAARAVGLVVCRDPLLGDGDDGGDPLEGAVGTVLVATDDDALNELLAARLADGLGAARVLALPAAPGRPALRARDAALEPPLFGAWATAEALAARFAAGARVRMRRSGEVAEGDLPLLVVRTRAGADARAVEPVTAREIPRAGAGDALLVLAPPPV